VGLQKLDTPYDIHKTSSVPDFKLQSVVKYPSSPPLRYRVPDYSFSTILSTLRRQNSMFRDSRALHRPVFVVSTASNSDHLRILRSRPNTDNMMLIVCKIFLTLSIFTGREVWSILPLSLTSATMECECGTNNYTHKMTCL
jgi:hypothetical protein